MISQAPCDVCHGSGKITLFLSITECVHCKGVGHIFVEEEEKKEKNNESASFPFGSSDNDNLIP